VDSSSVQMRQERGRKQPKKIGGGNARVRLYLITRWEGSLDQEIDHQIAGRRKLVIALGNPEGEGGGRTAGRKKMTIERGGGLMSRVRRVEEEE